MLSEQKKAHYQRKKRKQRISRKIRGTAEKPRMRVDKSNQHIFVQFIDDDAGQTIVGIGTMSMKSRKSKQSAKELGKKAAELAIEKKISKVVFDRNRYQYHGIVQSLAESAREAGLQF